MTQQALKIACALYWVIKKHLVAKKNMLKKCLSFTDESQFPQHYSIISKREAEPIGVQKYAAFPIFASFLIQHYQRITISLRFLLCGKASN